VPVPRHWLQKRGYLQGKRGIDKKPFKLPCFVADTGISKVRDTVQVQDDSKTSKQKQRERVKPGTGKIEIDYQVLNDAFFKYQTKPKLSRHGDLYYEGKEFCEGTARNFFPGLLSADLKAALGMLPSTHDEGKGEQAVSRVGRDNPEQVELPPPWLINMQRYGPPPSYPKLQIPGLTSPIPNKSAFGYHPGGWGKPPVDVEGCAVYGSQVFENSMPAMQARAPCSPCRRWGELSSARAGVSDNASNTVNVSQGKVKDVLLSFDSVTEGDGVNTAVISIADDDAAQPVAGQSGVDLRKGCNPGIDTPASRSPADAMAADAHFVERKKMLYTVLKHKSVSVEHTALWQSTHAYKQQGGDNTARENDKAKRRGESSSILGPGILCHRDAEKNESFSQPSSITSIIMPEMTTTKTGQRGRQFKF